MSETMSVKLRMVNRRHRSTLVRGLRDRSVGPGCGQLVERGVRETQHEPNRSAAKEGHTVRTMCLRPKKSQDVPRRPGATIVRVGSVGVSQEMSRTLQF